MIPRSARGVHQRPTTERPAAARAECQIHRMRRYSAFLFLAAVLAAPPARAQEGRPAPGPVIDSGPPISVYLITMGQGDPYWARFGHNALWIRDRERGRDVAYNWGLFDFDEPGFLTRFLSGNTRYWMAGFDVWNMLQVYRFEKRTIEVQELALSSDAARELRDFVEWNELPENRTYRYDYYRDNCSTRIRDALDRVLAGQIRMATDTILSGRTYRWHTRRLLADHLSTYAGISLVLGRPADRDISRWEEMFIPMAMRDHLRTLQISDGQGNLRPLITGEWRLFEANRAPERAVPPSRTIPVLVFGVLTGAVIALLAWVGTGPRSRRAGRTAATTLIVMWSALAGLAGIAAAGMWAFTHHVFMYANANVLQFNPLSLALLGLMPFVTRARSESRLAHHAALAGLVILGLSVAGLIAQLIPAFRQSSAEVIALALPIHAGVAAAVWRLAHVYSDQEKRTSRPSSADL